MRQHGKIEYFRPQKWLDFEASVVSLRYWKFSFSGGFVMFLWSDSDSLTCFAAWGWSQIALGSNYEGFMTGTRCSYQTWLPKLIFQVKGLGRYCELEPRT